LRIFRLILELIHQYVILQQISRKYSEKQKAIYGSNKPYLPVIADYAFRLVSAIFINLIGFRKYKKEME